MRRLALVAILGLAAGGGAGALARKAPPHHKPAKHKPAKHKPAKHKPAKHKPGKHKPAKHTPASTTIPATGGGQSSTTTPAAPVQDGTPTNTTPPPTTTPLAPPAHALGVTEGDAPGGRFTLSLSRTLVGAGAVAFSVHNASQDPHDLRIDTADGTPVNVWDEIPSGTVLDPQAVTLAAGTYRVYCTLPGHAALGMDKQITVQPG